MKDSNKGISRSKEWNEYWRIKRMELVEIRNGMSKNEEWNEYWKISRMEWLEIRNGMNIEEKEECIE